MDHEALGAQIALLNAFLNGTSACLLLAGRVAIARGAREAHKRWMTAALVTSSVFLASYLTRVALTGVHRDTHQGLFHTAYLALLGTHTLAAIASLPLIAYALWYALKANFVSHKRVVAYAWPVWFYVAVTGVMVYLMLYVF